MNNEVHPIIGAWFLFASLVTYGAFICVFMFWVAETTCERTENVYNCNFVGSFEPADPEEQAE